MGIQTHATLLRMEIKEVIWGAETDLQDSRVDKTLSREEQGRYFDSKVERKSKKKSCFGCKKPGAGFRYNLINGADK
jgi:hypothetical protein